MRVVHRCAGSVMKPSWRVCRYAIGPRTPTARVRPFPLGHTIVWHPVRAESGCRFFSARPLILSLIGCRGGW